MKEYGAIILILFFFLGCILGGCTSTTPPTVETHDSRLIGNWQETHTKEILSFRADGTYTITEAELANWSTAPGGKLWMYGTLYTYALLENNTVLNISEDSYTRTYHRV
jgi:hypothetical protein